MSKLIFMRSLKRQVKSILTVIFLPYHYGRSVILRKCNADKSYRQLEIGPGESRIEGYETLNIKPGPNIDYVFDAAKNLPFPDNTFDRIYASHVLEHIPWYQTQNALREWVRIIKPSGVLQVWVPDGLKICNAFVNAEKNNDLSFQEDNWFRFNPEKDPCVWAAGRIFTYGDGTGNPAHPNWHRAIYSERYLRLELERAGLVNLQRMGREDVLGDDHGWINMGIQGHKP